MTSEQALNTDSHFSRGDGSWSQRGLFLITRVKEERISHHGKGFKPRLDHHVNARECLPRVGG